MEENQMVGRVAAVGTTEEVHHQIVLGMERDEIRKTGSGVVDGDLEGAIAVTWGHRLAGVEVDQELRTTQGSSL